MRKRSNLFSIFVIFFITGLLVFGFFSTPASSGIRDFLQFFITPLQKTGFGMVGQITQKQNIQVQTLIDENSTLRQQLSAQKNAQEELKALREQFSVDKISAQDLLPAKIIGAKTFVPGVSYPEQITIDQGIVQKVSDGDVIIYKDNLIGVVEKAYAQSARIRLITAEEVSLTGKTLKTNAFGIVSGQEGRVMLLDKVLLSDKLEVNDVIVTKGDVDKESGFPPDLVIGKITSINKKASDLFQTAEIESLIDIVKLTHVFVMRKTN